MLKMTNLQTEGLLAKSARLENQKKELYSNLKESSIKNDEEYEVFYNSVQRINNGISSAERLAIYDNDEALEEVERRIFEKEEENKRFKQNARDEKKTRRLAKEKIFSNENSRKNDIDRTTIRSLDIELEDPDYISFINELSSLQRTLEEKKKSKRYERSIKNYIEYLYAKKELEKALEQLEIQKNMLYASLKDYGFASDMEFDAFNKSIQKINEDIDSTKIRITKLENSQSVRLMEYIDKTISEELRLMDLKRREGITSYAEIKKLTLENR